MMSSLLEARAWWLEEFIVFEHAFEILVDSDADLVLDLHVHVDHDGLFGGFHLHLRAAARRKREEPHGCEDSCELLSAHGHSSLAGR